MTEKSLHIGDQNLILHSQNQTQDLPSLDQFSCFLGWFNWHPPIKKPVIHPQIFTEYLQSDTQR